jgi:hypothetical protein
MISGTHIKSYFSQPRLTINALLLLIFSGMWFRDLLYWFPKDAIGTSLNYWAYTDWLIDYTEGFIRRGLGGQIIRHVPAWLPPLEFVTMLSWVLVLIVVFGYLRLLLRSIKSFHPLILFGMLFLPSLFIFYLHDHSGIARKEILGYVTVLLHLLVVEKSFPIGTEPEIRTGNLKQYVRWLLPITAILLPAIILVHEGNFLLFVPLHAMITLAVIRRKTGQSFVLAALWTGFYYLPAAIAFGAVYLSGTPSYWKVRDICGKWAAAGVLRENSCDLSPNKFDGSTLPGGFIPMVWSITKASEITRTIILMNWRSWIVILPVLGVSLWYLVRQVVYSSLRSQSSQLFEFHSALIYSGVFFRNYFAIPLLVSIPIYFSAFDYGRWFTVACINFAMLAVSVNLPLVEYLIRKRQNEEKVTAKNSPEHLDTPWVFYSVSIIICIFCLVLWLPHYCMLSCEIVQSPFDLFSRSLFAH